MPKKLIAFLIIVVALTAIGYYAYTKWAESRQKVDLWTLVPHDAVFVMESNDHSAFLNHLKSTEIWDNLSGMHQIQQLEVELSLLDSLAGRGNNLIGFLDNKVMLTSVHVTGNNRFGCIFYIPVNTVEEHRFVRKLVENVTKSDSYRVDSREYQGFQITDVTDLINETSFSYIAYHNNLIVSASPVMVEEVIRRIEGKEKISLAKGFENTNYLDQKDVYANVFINYKNLGRFLQLFFKEEVQPEIAYLASLCENSLLEFKLENNKVFLNGFSNSNKTADGLNAHLIAQKPKPLGITSYLPNRTALLLHFGIGDMAVFRKGNVEKTDSTQELDRNLVDSLALGFKDELAIVYLESYNINTKPEKVFFARSADPGKTNSQIREIVSQVVAISGESPQQEKYSRFRISLINTPDFPAKLFGKAFKGLEQTYVAQVDSYTVFTENVTAMRTVLSDIEAGSVWGKSVFYKSFLDETQHEANLSIFMNTNNAWYVLSRYLTEDKRETQLQNALLLKKFNLVSMQFSLTDNSQYYTSFLVKHQQEGPGKKKSDELVVDKTFKFDDRLISQPYPVRNPVDRLPEVVVQDSMFVLHNITFNGKKGWTDTITGPIAGKIHQFETGKNKQLRYIFATSNKIYSLDRNGNDVENFPFNLSDSLRIQNLSVFDYDKNGDYRLLVDDYLGNLYMLDMRGNLIPGWQPLQLDYRLAAPPQHYKVNGRDIILVVLENGYIYALTPDGTSYPGFPFSLRSPVTSGAYANLDANFRKSEFTIVTQQGEVVVFNLLGEVISRNQLIRVGKRTIFDLITEDDGKSFIISRQDLGRVTLFDQDMKQVLDKNFVTSAPKLIQYYHFGGDVRFYIITETGPQKTYIFDTKGQLIGNKKLDNSFNISVIYNEVDNQYQLYKAWRQELKKVVF